jgi:hypothetical protein
MSASDFEEHSADACVFHAYHAYRAYHAYHA